MASPFGHWILDVCHTILFKPRTRCQVKFYLRKLPPGRGRRTKGSEPLNPPGFGNPGGAGGIGVCIFNRAFTLATCHRPCRHRTGKRSILNFASFSFPPAMPLGDSHKHLPWNHELLPSLQT
jgi:hypothetical protein